MSAKEQFIKLPRELLQSEAWRSQSINCRRLIDFLMLEHMRHGGRSNGDLQAPELQLVSFGIGKAYVSAAIDMAEMLGLIDTQRGGMRVAIKYALTWLPLHDGSPASDRWRSYTKPGRRAKPSKNLPLKEGAALPLKEGVEGQNLPLNRGVEPCENLPLNRGVLSRKPSYQGGDTRKEVGGYGSALTVGDGPDEEAPPGDSAPSGKPGEVENVQSVEPDLDPTRTCGGYVTNAAGFRVCGKPMLVGTDHCPDHALHLVGVLLTDNSASGFSTLHDIDKPDHTGDAERDLLRKIMRTDLPMVRR